MQRKPLAVWLAVVCAFLMCSTVGVHARAYAQQIDQTGPILQVLADQQNAWNNGDIVTFMHGYADSPDTTFIGKTMEKGYAGILERYKKNYSSGAAMGVLKFSDTSVRLLGADHAVVTGHFHLARTAAGGGDVQGIFSLIFEKEAEGWKIILDHTTVS
jgi:ketosteroid isomerase-like protein